MNIGIICEYNPFHYGHIHHIKQIKKMYPNSNIMLVLSGWINERGDLSLIDKFKKTEIALEYGINLVIELPYFYMQSADIFAKGALEILNKFNVDKIVFGSESNDIGVLTKIAKLQIENKEYNTLVNDYIKQGLNYPTALSKAIKKECNIEIKEPNDILGICYIKEILLNKYNIEPITIKRTSNYNSKQIEGKITSSTSIRELIKEKKNIKKYVPFHEYYNRPIFLDDYFELIKYKIISTKDLTIFNGIDERIANRIKKYINKSYSIDVLLKNIKTKNYTYNRLKRCLIYILFNITKEEYNKIDLKYIRILGFDNKGKNILNKIKKTIDIPILTKYDDKYLHKDLVINTILSLNNKIKDRISFIEKEYKQKPIIKE